jgi:hypothetical protein
MIDKHDAIVQAAASLIAVGCTEKEACDKAEKLIVELQKRGYVHLDHIDHSFLIDGEKIEDIQQNTA